MSALLVLVLSVCTIPVADSTVPVPAMPAVRLIDLTGDGWLDKLYHGEGVGVSVAINRGGGRFERVEQALPLVDVMAVHVSDLNSLSGKPGARPI